MNIEKISYCTLYDEQTKSTTITIGCIDSEGNYILLDAAQENKEEISGVIDLDNLKFK